MLVEMADMSKKAHVGIVENVLVKINKFVFPSNFMVMDILGDPNEIMILGFEEEEQRESDMDGTYYDPPELSVDSFEVKRYSFDNGKSFVCVKKMLKDELPLGRVTGSRFKRMIRKEMEIAGSVQRTT
ncbi:hypothetical protein Tco_1123758 [Tanacetum coccineum]|uniref:Uncharacterized protein n=1 Tax=Tanacetum coccineum TaxID=301880 RepID=A0ABQ5J487_9ASTR